LLRWRCRCRLPVAGFDWLTSLLDFAASLELSSTGALGCKRVVQRKIGKIVEFKESNGGFIRWKRSCVEDVEDSFFSLFFRSSFSDP
jgi:hypothetical protein